MALSEFDRELIAATQSGLPLVDRPYEAIGAVPNHYRLGWVANGMTVWDVADERIDALGAQVGALPGVTHCYRRPRSLPQWPYNLFAMVHGHTRADVERQALEIEQLLGDACRGHDILYSSAILKKTGLRLSES
jgi:DNA-binding Lrp family transcriptional regulator